MENYGDLDPDPYNNPYRSTSLRKILPFLYTISDWISEKARYPVRPRKFNIAKRFLLNFTWEKPGHWFKIKNKKVLVTNI